MISLWIADVLLSTWYMIIFFGLIPIVYKALTAMDVSRIFKRNSTWEIRLLVLLMSIVLSYLTASAFVAVLERIINIIRL